MRRDDLTRRYFPIKTSQGDNKGKHSTFIEECHKNYDQVWKWVRWEGNYVALCSRDGNASIIFSNSTSAPPVHLKSGSSITCGRIHIRNGCMYVYVGHKDGKVSVYECTSKTVSIVQDHKVSGQSIQEILYQPVANKNNSCSFWAVSSSSATFCIGDQIQLQCSFQTSGQVDFLSAQLLNSSAGGEASVLAVCLQSSVSAFPSTSSTSPSTSTSLIQVYMIDTKLTIETTQRKNLTSYTAAASSAIVLRPVCEVPFQPEPAAGRTSRSTGSANSETVVQCVVDPYSVCSIGRVCPSSPDLAVSPRLSFVLRVLGSGGSEVAASFLTPQQKLINRLLEVGGSAFATPNALTAGEDPLRSSTTTAVFKPDGSYAQEPTSLPSSPLDTAFMPLWRAMIKLDMLPPCRKELILSMVKTLDDQSGASLSSSNTSSGGADRDFAISRQVLLEGAMSSGLAPLVASYVLERSADCDSPSGYVLVDVRRFHEWALGESESIVSLQTALETTMATVCRQHILQALLTGSVESSGAPWFSDLLSLRDLASGLKLIAEALLERKSAALGGEEMDDEITRSVVEEGLVALRVQILQLTCLLQVLSVMVEISTIKSLTFKSFVTSAGTHTTIAASMFSIYQRTKRQRAEVGSNVFNPHLPDYLQSNSESLLEGLRGMLDDSAQFHTSFLLNYNGNPLGANIEDFCTSFAAFLVMPLTSLKNEAKLRMNVLHTSMRGGQCSEIITEIEPAMQTRAHVAFSVLLFVLADMQFLSLCDGMLEDHATVTKCLDAVRQVIHTVGAAMQVPHTVQMGVLALWQVESGLGVSQAVRLLCSTDTTILADREILVAVIKRLLCAGHLIECKELLSHLQHSNHEIVHTKFFIMATAAAVARPEMWQFSWHSAKSLAVELFPDCGSEEAIQLRRELVYMMAKWAIENQQLGNLLDCVLDKEEGEEVELVLRSLADRDISRGAFPSAAVDLAVMFLLRETKYVDAMELHDRHIAAVDPVLIDPSQVESRRALIAAQAAIPTIPMINY